MYTQLTKHWTRSEFAHCTGCVIFIIVYFIMLLSFLDSVTNLVVYEARIPNIEGSDEDTTLVKLPDITCFISHDGDALAKLNASEKLRKNDYICHNYFDSKFTKVASK